MYLGIVICNPTWLYLSTVKLPKPPNLNNELHYAGVRDGIRIVFEHVWQRFSPLLCPPLLRSTGYPLIHLFMSLVRDTAIANIHRNLFFSKWAVASFGKYVFKNSWALGDNGYDVRKFLKETSEWLHLIYKFCLKFGIQSVSIGLVQDRLYGWCTKEKLMPNSQKNTQIWKYNHRSAHYSCYIVKLLTLNCVFTF